MPLSGRPLRRRTVAAVSVLGLLAAAVVADPAAAGQRHAGGYAATIQRASYGVPHITARDFAGLGYGVGYAQAEDNICLIAETMVTVNAERSQHFGNAARNVTSDLFHRRAIDGGAVERLLTGPRDGIRSPSDEAREQMRGFAAGYNAYLRRTGAANITDPACAGKPWVRPITELDLWRSHWARMVRAGSGALADGITAAAPPRADGTPAPAAAPQAKAVVDARDGAPAGVGSNAYGLGREATARGAGMLLANPHFPWDGADRFYRMRLKVPGRYDVEGASLVGEPLVQIGHNGRVAWSHTVSTARRFTWHRLTLVPGDPTAYRYDGRTRKMTTRTVTVRTQSGTVTRTLYDTHLGPVVVVPGRFEWTTGTAYAVSDPNASNNRALDGWLAMARARTVGELRAVLDRRQFLPWVNTIAADQRGSALYGDHSVVPRVTDAVAAACIPAEFRDLYATRGQAVLDGSRSACAPGKDPDAAVPGILGPANLPVLVRGDYVTNSNDSHWLANPQQPLAGFPRILGDERTARSLRTRLGLLQVQQRVAGTDGLPGTGFTTANLWQVALGNRAYGGELVRDDLVALCEAQPAAIASDGSAVDLTAACAALRGWDLRVDLDSRGSHVFTEFARAGGLRFADPFDPAAPVSTPRRLAVDDPRVRTALADAVRALGDISLDAQLGDIQTEPRGDERIPIHGGWPEGGVFNMIISVVEPGVGYRKVQHGTSFLMAVELGRGGPSGRQLLTYSQSANPNSPWYADQTRLYSGKGFDTIKFTERQLRADPNLITYRVGERRR
ncbi:penicillin acylase family protein [Micromonospora sp. KC721]|uniref:penicillin acylase family protein n=1 Tax=Micromonospora sp. KC721 TaxID=2530380 RepID=UPI0010515653|nr:penicillin acylase family protein [Micromonospora sp. KC721]TDB81398.1 acylase [Micromonospora sp. KC721]